MYDAMRDVRRIITRMVIVSFFVEIINVAKTFNFN